MLHFVVSGSALGSLFPPVLGVPVWSGVQAPFDIPFRPKTVLMLTVRVLFGGL